MNKIEDIFAMALDPKYSPKLKDLKRKLEMNYESSTFACMKYIILRSAMEAQQASELRKLQNVLDEKISVLEQGIKDFVKFNDERICREMETQVNNKLQKEQNMKIGDEGYWQVGDEVYDLYYGKDVVHRIVERCGYHYVYLQERKGCFDLDGKPSHIKVERALYHLGAITFDEQDRPIAINYDYVPKRTPKLVTKKLEEFKHNEVVFFKTHRGGENGQYSVGLFHSSTPSKAFVRTSIKGIKHLVDEVYPLKGNEWLFDTDEDSEA